MGILSTPLTVAELIQALRHYPPDSKVYVHASNGWGSGPARNLTAVEINRGVHLYGSYL